MPDPTFKMDSVTVMSKSGNDVSIASGVTNNAGVASGTIASGVVFPTGHTIRHSFYSIGEGTLSNNSFPEDDTTPQRGEGSEIWSQAYTPTTAATDIYIRANVKLGETSSLSNDMAVGLFLSSQNDVLVVAQGNESENTGGGNYIVNYLHAFIDYKMSSWGETARTFSLRSSGAQAYNYYEDYSAYSRGDRYTGKITSSVIIIEVA
ncbi:MAG: hypothetical protein QGH83_11230 [Candidatus Pacebacteria bacterium]|nr:hypothetical protein [Candidatus Paceibacterota bacterium]